MVPPERKNSSETGRAVLVRVVIVVLGLAGAALIALGGLTVTWWSLVDENAGTEAGEGSLQAAIGLTEMQVCTGGSCAPASLSKLDATGMDWVRVGTGAYAATWIAGLLALLLAAVVAASKPSWPTLGKTAISAAAGALLTGVGFLWLAPELSEFRTGVGPWLYLSGAVVIAVAGALSARREAEAR